MSALDPAFLDALDTALAPDDARRARLYPGTSGDLAQPVHTAYVPLDQVGPDTCGHWGRRALAALDEHGPLPGVDPAVEQLVRRKLAVEPVEDLRLDAEDGYGLRSDVQEDHDVRGAARALAGWVAAGTAPRCTGLRTRSLEGPTRRRALRTLDLFLEELLAHAALPSGFRITLPKVTSVAQVEAMVAVCAALEEAYALAPLRVELQVETPQAVQGPDGTALVAPMLHALGGRCAGLHYGTYDYSAALGVAAAYQSMDHPVADHAKAVMQLAAAGTGAVVCDGSTNVLPVGSTDQVRAAWALHARLVRRSLERGIYQGWDLHPAQLPTRYAATYTFYREGLDAAAARLRAYRERQAPGVLDEPATARALAGFLLRSLECGAVGDDEVEARAGLGRGELAALAR